MLRLHYGPPVGAPNGFMTSNKKKAVILIALLCLIIAVLIPTRERMDLFLDIDSKVGFSLVYIYIPILYLLLLIKKKVKTK
jgi:hypothetical protein